MVMRASASVVLLVALVGCEPEGAPFQGGPPEVDAAGAQAAADAGLDDAGPVSMPDARASLDQAQAGQEVGGPGVACEGALIGAVGYQTLAAALAGAIRDDIIDVCPGIHRGPFLIDKAIELRARSGLASDTILEGNGGDGILSITIREASTSLVRITALTFRGGRREGGGGYGAALLADAGAPIEIRECVFEGNESGYGGGAVAIRGGVGVRFIESTFRGNRSGYEGGAIDVFIRNNRPALTIDTCTFENNTAEYEGGAVSIYHDGSGDGAPEGTIVVRNSVFRGNSAGYEGGGLGLSSATGSYYTLSVMGTRFEDNVASYSGGALQAGGWGVDDVKLVDCLASGNSAGTAGSAYNFNGGRVAPARRSQISIVGGSIVRNGRTSADGDALEADPRAVVTVMDVNLGAGPDENLAGDVAGCSQRYGAGSTFTYDVEGAPFCR